MWTDRKNHVAAYAKKGNSDKSVAHDAYSHSSNDSDECHYTFYSFQWEFHTFNYIRKVYVLRLSARPKWLYRCLWRKIRSELIKRKKKKIKKPLKYFTLRVFLMGYSFRFRKPLRGSLSRNRLFPRSPRETISLEYIVKYLPFIKSVSFIFPARTCMKYAARRTSGTKYVVGRFSRPSVFSFLYIGECTCLLRFDLVQIRFRSTAYCRPTRPLDVGTKL